MPAEHEKAHKYPRFSPFREKHFEPFFRPPPSRTCWTFSPPSSLLQRHMVRKRINSQYHLLPLHIQGENQNDAVDWRFLSIIKGLIFESAKRLFDLCFEIDKNAIKRNLLIE